MCQRHFSDPLVIFVRLSSKINKEVKLLSTKLEGNRQMNKKLTFSLHLRIEQKNIKFGLNRPEFRIITCFSLFTDDLQDNQ